MEERKSRQRRRKEDKLRHWRLHSCLGVLSVSLSCQFGTFLEAWNLARSQHCSRSSPLCSEGIYREPKIDSDWVKTPFWQWMHSPFFLPLFPPRLSHLHFCDWHISWAPVPGMPSWHGSGSGRVCSASWWPHFCPGQHRSPHCRRRKNTKEKWTIFSIQSRVNHAVCDCMTLWQSTLKVIGHKKNKRIIFHFSKQTETHGNRWRMTLCFNL